MSYTVNKDIAFGLLTVGTISVAVLHPCLRRVGKHSKVWLLALMFSWTLLSIAHGHKDQDEWADSERFLEKLQMHATVEDCGNNAGPMSFCLGPRYQGFDESQEFFVITTKLIRAVHIVCGCLVVRDLIPLLDSAISWFLGVGRGRVAEWMRDQIHRRHRLHQCVRVLHQCVRVLSPIAGLLIGLLNLLGFGVLTVGLHDVIKALKKVKDLNDGQHSWGFGQLAAMAVRFPVALKFAKTLLRVCVGGFSFGVRFLPSLLSFPLTVLAQSAPW